METSEDLMLIGDESATELLRNKALWSVSSWEPPVEELDAGSWTKEVNIRRRDRLDHPALETLA